MPAEPRTQIRISPQGEIEIDIPEGFDAGQLEAAIDILQGRGLLPIPRASPPAPTGYQPAASGVDSQQEPTLKERLQLFLKVNFSGRWFDSAEVKEVYDDAYADTIRPSTVSTYLSRFAQDGFLERKGNRNQRRYRLMDEPPAAGPVDSGAGERAAE